MRLVGRKLLDDFGSRHADIRPPMRAWILEIQEGLWSGPGDMKARYPSASILAENRVVFNIKGNKYRIEVKVNYELQVVLILRIGTHHEYSKWKS